MKDVPKTGERWWHASHSGVYTEIEILSVQIRPHTRRQIECISVINRVRYSCSLARFQRRHRRTRNEAYALVHGKQETV